MATTTQKQWTKQGGWSPTGAASTFFYYNSDETNLGVVNDILRFNLGNSGVPQDTVFKDAFIVLGRFDSHGTPTATFSVRLTNGTADYEVIKDATIGRTAEHTEARPGGGSTDELTAVGLPLTTTAWYIEVELTAAHATATTSGRKIALFVDILATT